MDDLSWVCEVRFLRKEGELVVTFPAAGYLGGGGLCLELTAAAVRRQNAESRPDLLSNRVWEFPGELPEMQDPRPPPGDPSLQDEQQPRAPGDRTTGRSLRSQVGIASINQMSCIGRNQELETELAFEVRASGQS